MARSITVKVATPKVIKALEAKLAKIQNDFANQEKNEAKFQKELTAYNKQLLKLATANFAKATDVRTNYREWNNQLNVDFNLVIPKDEIPAEPKRDFVTQQDWKVKEMVEEITNALNILKMTDEETVNASTMKSIAQYL